MPKRIPNRCTLLFPLLAFLIILSLVFALSSSHAGPLWLSINEPQEIPQQGEVFETELQFSSWDLTIGAFEIDVHYDETVLRIVSVSAPVHSLFENNTFADEGSFSSGTTHIAGFQTTTQEQQDSLTTILVITWEAIGPVGGSTDIILEPKALADPLWRPFNTNLQSIHIEIAEIDSDRDGLSDDDEISIYCTDPYLADSDGDNINDGYELDFWNGCWNLDYDEDGIANNLLDKDADGDGFFDGNEITLGYNPADPDNHPEIPFLDEFSSAYGTKIDEEGYDNACDFDNDLDVDGLDLFQFIWIFNAEYEEE